LTGNEAAPGDAGPHIPGLKGCPEPLSEHYDAALLDLDGVVYLGGTPIPGAADALAGAAKRGMKLAYVTNNASRSPSAIAAQLTGMGVPASATDIVTSAQAAAHILADRLPAGAPVLVVGGTGLRLAVRDRGLRPVTTAADKPLAVVQGYSPAISYGLLAEAAIALDAGALFVASNADATLPTPRGPQPGNGSLVQVLVHATGHEPIVAGKPELPLHAESVQRVGAKRPLVVGDRLDTDIEGAVRGGTDSMLVLTGVSEPADLLLAGPQRRPSFVAADLSGLNTSHPEITRARDGVDGDGVDGAGVDGAGPANGGAFSCGGWKAAAAGGDAWLTVSGSGAWLDGLRALCAAAWSAGPPPGNEQEQRRTAEAVLTAIESAR
jgi:glycerol 3-phosphatase-2